MAMGGLGGLDHWERTTSFGQDRARQLLQHQDSPWGQEKKQHCGRLSWIPECYSAHDENQKLQPKPVQTQGNKRQGARV